MDLHAVLQTILGLVVAASPPTSVTSAPTSAPPPAVATGPARTPNDAFAARDRFLTNGMIVSGTIGGASLLAGSIYLIITSVPGATASVPSQTSQDPALVPVYDSFLPVIVAATLLTIGGVGAITFGGFAGARRKHRREGRRLQVGSGGGLLLRF